jgi:hypothetical protein
MKERRGNDRRERTGERAMEESTSCGRSDGGESRDVRGAHEG